MSSTKEPKRCKGCIKENFSIYDCLYCTHKDSNKETKEKKGEKRK